MRFLILVILIIDLVGCSKKTQEVLLPESPLLATATRAIVTTYTSTPAGISTPYDTPTPQPASSSDDLFESVTIHPRCESAADTFQCYDPILDIEFAYSSEWGVVTATYSSMLPQYIKDNFAGSAYTYNFSESPQNEPYSVRARGQSNDFTLPRDGTIINFSGFGERTTDNFCEPSGQYSICQAIKPGVIIRFSLPQAMGRCAYPYVSYPAGFVYINLPMRRLINGFVFAYPIVPPQQQRALDHILGIENNRIGPECEDEQYQQEYDAQLEKLLEQIQTRSGDSELMQRLNIIYNLANSVQGQETGK